VAELDSYVVEVARRLSAAVAEDLVGVYLHGSAAMGAFVPSRSDVDVLAVTRGPIVTTEKLAVADALSESSLPCPGVGLEMSIVTLDVARTPSERPAFELHVNTHQNWARVVDGEGHAGDPDLLAHFAMARARGVALLGPPPEDLIAPVDRSHLLRSLADDLASAIDGELGSYAVLNACRALRLVREGVLCSKPEGGRWAMSQGIVEADLVGTALRRQGGEDVQVDVEAGARFASRVRAELFSESKR
jgi:hypothetical protein